MDIKSGLTRTMNRRNRNLGVWLLVDFAIVALAYGAVYMSRAATSSATLSIQFSYMAVAASAGVILVMLYAFGVYRRLWSQTSGHEVTVLVTAVGTATIIITVADLLILPRPLPLSVVLLGGLLALAGMVAARYRSRLVSGLSWRWGVIWSRQLPKPTTRVLIIGAGESGQDLAWRLKHRFQDTSYRVIGFIDDDAHKQQMFVEGCPVLGGRHDIERIVRDHSVDLIVVARASRSSRMCSIWYATSTAKSPCAMCSRKTCWGAASSPAIKKWI
jgi:FlaA1/EpsC-like NDP-sugar epimerase